MENMIPINGRIAIVDDQIEQALPLMRVLSKNNIPYVYYRGNDMNYLPENPENDIRILFLDLNLLGGKDNQPKDIRSTLFSVISRIISPNNYPYVLILWSRQEKEYKEMLESLFDNDLQNCAPIAIKDYIKSDFFPNFAENEENEENEYKILEELKVILAELPAYRYLIQWENCVHNSADVIIQDIFHDFHSHNNWQNNANYILDMFAKAYLDKHHKNASLEEKAKASLFFLNDVYYDTLESTIANSKVENVAELDYEIEEDQICDIQSKINGYLFVSKSQMQINQPGCIFTGTNSNIECVRCAKEILNSSLNTEDIRNQVKEQFPDIKQQEAKHLYNQLMKERRDAISSTFLPCGVVVTPVCDYAQKKAKYDRVVMGIIIDSCYKQFIDTKSDAIYISPSYSDGNHERILVLNYRYFITQELRNANDARILYRVRNTILAEIQSKLARHISRQGLMSL